MMSKWTGRMSKWTGRSKTSRNKVFPPLIPFVEASVLCCSLDHVRLYTGVVTARGSTNTESVSSGAADHTFRENDVG